MSTVLIIAGPTASGKSSFAMKVAEKYHGDIINADSLQVYEGIELVTSQPTLEAKKHCPHYLYGILKPDQPCSAGLWRKMAVERIKKSLDQQRLPIIVGGTGLYIKALADGLSPIPPIKDSIREQARALFDVIGPDEYYKLVKARDPIAAEHVSMADKQRMIRIMEVYEGTGQRLSQWQKNTPKTSEPWSYYQLLLLPPRDQLYEKINRRFHEMVSQGVIEEVRHFIAANYPPLSTAHKAVGVKEIAAYLAGQISLEQAIQKACQLTRNYAKRQYTWFRGQFSADKVLESDAQIKNFEI